MQERCNRGRNNSDAVGTGMYRVLPKNPRTRQLDWVRCRLFVVVKFDHYNLGFVQPLNNDPILRSCSNGVVLGTTDRAIGC